MKTEAQRSLMADNLNDWQDVPLDSGSVNDWQDVPLDQKTDSLIEESEKPLRDSMFLAKDKSPDEVASSFKLAKKMSLPEDATDFVGRNYSELKKESEFDQTDFGKLIKDYPKTSSFLSNPVNGQLAKDDIEHLTWFEKAAKSYEYSQSASRKIDDLYFPRAATASLIVGGAELGKMASRSIPYLYDLVETIRKKKDNLQPELLDKSWYENKAAKFFDDISETFIKDIPQLSDNAAEQIMEGDFNGAAATLGLKILQSMPVSIAAGAAFVTGGPLIGIGEIGSGAAGEDYYQNFDNENVSPEINIITSGAKGLAEGAFEVLGLEKAVGSLAKGMFKASGKAGLQATAQAMRPLMEAFGAEAGEEFFTNITQDLTEFVSGRDPNAIKGMLSRGIEAGLVGGFSGIEAQLFTLNLITDTNN